MMACRFAALLAALFLLAGCGHQEYHVLLTPQGERVERRLEWTSVGGQTQQGPNGPTPIPAGDNREDKRLAGLYHSAGKVEQNHLIYVGLFSGKLPADIGGFGTYRQFQSDLGTLTLYSERFRGDDDLTGQVAAIEHAADRITDLMIEWFAHEMRGDARYFKLREFMDQDMRRDLKNLALLFWRQRLAMETDATRSTKSGKEWMTDILGQMAQYLLERGYFTVDELPMITRELARGNAAGVMAPIQRFAARRMGVKDADPIPASLAFLGDADRATKSLEAYLGTTPEHRKALGDWEAKKADVGEEKAGDKPEPMAVLVDQFAALVDFRLNIFGGPDVVSVELACPLAPLATNGEWDAKAKRITWASAALGGKGEPALVRFAVWAQPDEEAQKVHLGGVVLHDVNLASYVLWRNGLTKTEAKEWSAFLAGLKPGAGMDELKKQITGFHFSTQASPSNPPKTGTAEPDGIAVLLLDALAPKPVPGNP